MEHINNQNLVWQTIHMKGNDGANYSTAVQPVINDPNGWHTYGMEWTADCIKFYVDGVLTNTVYASAYTYWPFDDGEKFHLLIDQQIGGSWPGEANPSDLANNSADFCIDYVRVYSKATNTPSAAECPSWGERGPLESDGDLISYNTVSGVNGGALDVAVAGDYHYAVTQALGRILAEDSNIKLTTGSSSTVNISGGMVQARSLYLAEGKYVIKDNTTVDVDTLFVVGGSLEAMSENALNSVEYLYLGMESDVIGGDARRNSALYVTAGQHLKADVTLVNDSKIAVYKGNTLNLGGSVHAANYTLNMVGVSSEGVSTVILSGSNNDIGRLTLGVAETTPLGNTFVGAGQILALQMQSGSTQVGELVTNSNFTGDKASSLRVGGGASLTVSKEWKNASDRDFNVTIDQGGKLMIGNGTDTAVATFLPGVNLQNNGLLHVQNGAEMQIDSLTVSSAGNADGNRATLKVDGRFSADSVTVDGKGWQAIGTLDVLCGDNVSIGNLTTGSNGQVDISVGSGNLRLQTLTLSNSQYVVIQSESHSLGTVTVQNTVNNTYTIVSRAGRVQFAGGLSGNGAVQVQNNAVVAITGSAGSQSITLDAAAALETAGNYSGGTVYGSGTIRKTDAGTAQVTVASTFSGSLRVEQGVMQVSGAASFDALAAVGGELTLLNTSGVITSSVQISEGGKLSLLSNSKAPNALTLAPNGALTASEGVIAADLVLQDGGMLNLSVDGGLVVQGAITMSGSVALGLDIVNDFLSGNQSTFTLIEGAESLTIGDQTWNYGDSALAATVFTGVESDLADLRFSYLEGERGGRLVLSLSVPEPSSSALSLLALAGMVTRRRRK